jgi:hypothetical protein
MSNSLRDIATVNYHKNYKGRSFDLDYAITCLDEYEGPLFTTENVIIRYEEVDESTIEFHCMNAGSGKDLTKAVVELLQSLPTRYDRAVTYYDNPRINVLVPYLYFPVQVEKIDDGVDRTYEMRFDLRGR